MQEEKEQLDVETGVDFPAIHDPTLNNEREAWEEIEANDDYLIEVDDLVTEVGVLATGEVYLALPGYFRLANNLGIDITEIIETETDKVFRCRAKATMASGINRYGGCEEEKLSRGNRPVAHAYSKSVNKAQRNAIKNCVHGHKNTHEAFKQYLSAQALLPKQEPVRQQPPAALPSPMPSESATLPEASNLPDPIAEARKAASAAVKAITANLKIEEAVLWERVKVRFGRTESKYMTLEDWQMTVTELQTYPRLEWVETAVEGEADAST